MRITSAVAILGILFLPLAWAWASPDRVYLSPMEESRWTLTVDSPVRCEIEHLIPRFGKAVFYQESAREMGLRFISDHHFRKDLKVAFHSVTANWKSIQTQAVIADLTTTGGNNPLVEARASTARHAYFELQQGYQPSLFFIDDDDGFNSVSVILSTVRFRDVEADFGRCISNLHPYHFDDIKNTLVHFEFDEEFPKEEEEHAVLGRIIDYLKADPSVKGLVVSGHADFKGSDCYNDSLSARRAWYVYDYLVANDIEPSMIEVKFFGESSPRDKGRSDAARAKNRRVRVDLLR